MTRQIQPPMTDERLDRLVRQLLTERGEDVAGDALPADAMAERIETRMRPAPLGRTWVLLAAALLTALMIGGGLAVGGQLRLPWPPSPPQRLDWTGPLRPEAATMPRIVMQGPSDGTFNWSDGRDTSVSWIDIGEVRAGSSFRRLQWGMELSGAPPRASTLDPTERLIEYGVVLDAEGDGVADCLIGISNDAPERGDFRVWVTNLSTGTSDEQIGPGYGKPIDFSHPDEQSSKPRSMEFFFLFGSATPCELPAGTVRFYAWASVTDAGQVIAWDYAPDAAWLVAPHPEDQP
jgi:hypothetical protein